MFKNFLKNLINFLLPTIILLVVGFLAWKNYEPGTILAGWDSLHPEFNFPLAIKRAFFGVWRPEQGVGAIAAHAHMADLPRILILWISSIFVSTQFLRYFYILLCLLIGPLGIYFFLKYLFEKKEKGIVVNLASFLGALYYLLNLGTMQNFILPFEMFNTQYAVLPWLFLFIARILDDGKKKNYLIFFILSILAAPMAYASALFYAYLGGLMLFLVIQNVLTRSKLTLRRSISIVFLILATNAFWILPNIYSIKNQSETISNSKINSLFSPEAFLRNKDYGSLSNILIHKGFLFSWRAYDFSKGEYVDLLGAWNNHLSDPFIANLGLAFGIVCIFGVILAFIKRDKIGISIFTIGVFSIFFLINDNFPTSSIYKFLYDNFAVFREGYRMPFTKFSILFMFSMSYFFGFFFFRFFSSISKKRIFKLLPLVISSLTSIGLCLFMLPAFNGQLISSVVKNKIPNEYFEVYKYLNGKEGRVAKLPIQSLYNWEYHSWKYEGSAWFTWFISDISQFDRDFDRWSSFNESFYNEASYALYANDSKAFNSVLEKYKINYLLLDESVINAGGTSETLYVPQVKEMLKSVGYFESQKFGFITLYQKNLEGLVFESPSSYVQLDNDAKYVQSNINYSKYNNYINFKGETSYPFSDLDPRENVKIHLEDNRLVFENQQSNAKIFLPTKNKISENFNNKRGYALGYNCDLLKEGFVDKVWYSDSVRYIAKDGGVSCDFFAYQNLSYKNSYVLHIQGQNKKGRSLKVYLYNFASKKMDLEELLPEGDFDKYFIVYQKPNLEKQEGYSLNIETRSFGKVESENILSSIEFYPFDLSTIESIYKGNPNPDQINNNLELVSTQNRGNDYLLTAKRSGVLFFNQGYDSGWQAFDINCQKGFVCSVKKILPWFFEKPLEHFKVNSWANGWKVDSDEASILIVFWPQYLEWIGFGVLLLSFYVVVFQRDKKIKK